MIGFGTIVTGVGFVLRVTSKVLPQIATCSEATVTNLALVRSLARVNALMNLEVGLVSEFLSAYAFMTCKHIGLINSFQNEPMKSICW